MVSKERFRGSQDIILSWCGRLLDIPKGEGVRHVIYGDDTASSLCHSRKGRAGLLKMDLLGSATLNTGNELHALWFYEAYARCHLHEWCNIKKTCEIWEVSYNRDLAHRIRLARCVCPRPWHRRIKPRRDVPACRGRGVLHFNEGLLMTMLSEFFLCNAEVAVSVQE